MQRNEKREMPSVIHEIVIVGPSMDIQELQAEVNDRLEGLAKTIVNGVQLYESTKGWIVVIWYKAL